MLRPIESFLYRVLRVQPEEEMTAPVYLGCFAAFTVLGTVLLFLLLLAQQWLPGGPEPRYLTTPLTSDLAANIAISFSTTTTWQAYAGESTLRYLSQLLGLTAQNFLAGAAGLAVGIAFLLGVGGSVLAAVVTSNGATGSYNSMHDSYQPLGVLVLLANMLLGEVVFGGLGTGLASLIMIALVGTFMGGLMIGRTPEYLGKTITTAEAKLIALSALLTPLTVLPLTGWALVAAAGQAGLTTNGGPRGFTEILFAYASCLANNGQTLAGLNANSVFFNLTTAAAMLVGRLGPAVLTLLLAGRFAAQGRKPATIGTLPCDTPTFGVLTLGVVLLVGALCFLPALALGPMAEHLQPPNVLFPARTAAAIPLSSISDPEMVQRP